MLHAVKKQLSRAKQPLVSAPNAEFADYKQRLISIKQSLKYTSSMLTSANRAWIVQMQQQRLFSERFHDSYPTTHDDVYVVSQKFAAGSQLLYDKFTRDVTEEVDAFRKIQEQVLVYIKEIETLEARYTKIAAAKAEAARYQSKLDAMERGRRQTDESKKNRNLQKMDRYKEQYKKLLKATIDDQKIVYAKHPIVFKAALTSYWLNHEKHVNMLIESLEDTQTFAREHEADMRELDIATYEPDLAALIPGAASPSAIDHISLLASNLSSAGPSSTSSPLLSPASDKTAGTSNKSSQAQLQTPVPIPKPALPAVPPIVDATNVSGTAKPFPIPTSPVADSEDGGSPSNLLDAENSSQLDKPSQDQYPAEDDISADESNFVSAHAIAT